MGTTYEGRLGRVVGATFGSVFLAVGLGLSFMLADMTDVVPAGVEAFVGDVAPFLLRTHDPTMSTVDVLIPGGFAAVCLLFGGYQVARAALEDDYSITLSRGHHP